MICLSGFLFSLLEVAKQAAIPIRNSLTWPINYGGLDNPEHNIIMTTTNIPNTYTMGNIRLQDYGYTLLCRFSNNIVIFREIRGVQVQF